LELSGDFRHLRIVAWDQGRVKELILDRTLMDPRDPGTDSRIPCAGALSSRLLLRIVDELLFLAVV
jgi:hypothetical protein